VYTSPIRITGGLWNLRAAAYFVNGSVAEHEIQSTFTVTAAGTFRLRILPRFLSFSLEFSGFPGPFRRAF
jgi:hypothetical protein